MKYLWRLFLIGAIFFVGFGADRFLTAHHEPKQTKPIEVSKEATATASLSASPSGELFRVARVIDGDTIEVEGGKRVRYIGIDTPETVSPQKPVQCFGVEASAANKTLVEGKMVRLEKDISETDKYGRLLRYVYVDDALVNDYLVRQGFAHASTFPPDVKYAQQFLEAEREARGLTKGLWAGCVLGESQTNAPINIHGANENKENSACIIKGNISATGDKIYHIPGCGSYDKTVVDTGAGEQWFCSENEAAAAGWRKAKNCP